MENAELLNKILELQADNKIAFMNIDGLNSIDIIDFNNQPLNDKLYNLNRDRETLYLMANEGKNKRWVNDLAMVYFIEYLSELIEKQRQEIVNLKSDKDEFLLEFTSVIKEEIRGPIVKNIRTLLVKLKHVFLILSNLILALELLFFKYSCLYILYLFISLKAIIK